MTNPRISPKVTSAGISSGAILVLIAVLSAITPDMLDWAGQWTPVIYAAIPALAAVLGAYVKRDPDREHDGGWGVDMDALAAAETDDTPPPPGWEPRH